MEKLEIKQQPATTLDEYQEKAMTTCMPSCRNYTYMFGNLAAELGEFSGKISKARRKGLVSIKDDNLIWNYTGTKENEMELAQLHEDLLYELGDILWQLSGLADVMGYYMHEVADYNLMKLESRQQRNKIDGDGDHR